MISTVQTPLPILAETRPKIWPHFCAPSPGSETISTVCSLTRSAVGGRVWEEGAWAGEDDEDEAMGMWRSGSDSCSLPGPPLVRASTAGRAATADAHCNPTAASRLRKRWCALLARGH